MIAGTSFPKIIEETTVTTKVTGTTIPASVVGTTVLARVISTRLIMGTTVPTSIALTANYWKSCLLLLISKEPTIQVGSKSVQ